MNCSKIMDLYYENSDNDHKYFFGNEMPLFQQLQIGFHTFFCPECSRKIELYKETRDVMRYDFFPVSPDLEDSILTKINLEQITVNEQEEPDYSYTAQGGLSTRGWVIAGIIILFSLVTVFWGLDFQHLVSESGVSFLLPMGITIGIVLTIYGALFIGSHLKELSERFGL